MEIRKHEIIPGKRDAREKIAALACFEPWERVIGGGAYPGDFYDAKEETASAGEGTSAAGLLSGQAAELRQMPDNSGNFLCGKENEALLSTAENVV